METEHIFYILFDFFMIGCVFILQRFIVLNCFFQPRIIYLFIFNSRVSSLWKWCFLLRLFTWQVFENENNPRRNWIKLFMPFYLILCDWISYWNHSKLWKIFVVMCAPFKISVNYRNISRFFKNLNFLAKPLLVQEF